MAELPEPNSGRRGATTRPAAVSLPTHPTELQTLRVIASRLWWVVFWLVAPQAAAVVLGLAWATLKAAG